MIRTKEDTNRTTVEVNINKSIVYTDKILKKTRKKRLGGRSHFQKIEGLV